METGINPHQLSTPTVDSIHVKTIGFRGQLSKFIEKFKIRLAPVFSVYKAALHYESIFKSPISIKGNFNKTIFEICLTQEKQKLLRSFTGNVARKYPQQSELPT